MYKIHLATSYFSCPRCWQNLVTSLEVNKGCGATYDDIVAALEKHNIQYVVDGPSIADAAHLLFESEEAATAFILRYS